MKKFLLVAFFLLFGITTTTISADTAVDPANSAEFATANQIDTFEWSIIGGPVYIVVAGMKFFAEGGGSFQVSGLTVSDVEIEAAEGYELCSKSVYISDNKIVAFAIVSIPEL